MKSANKMILLVALVCAAPFVSAWVAYYFWQPQGGRSYGELLPTQPLPALTVSSADAEAFKGKWRMVMLLPESCDKACDEMLYATRQARTMLGRDKDRVLRVGLSPLSRATLDDKLGTAHPDLQVVRAATDVPQAWRAPLEQGVLLVDPLGNQVILWPKNPDIKKLNQDLARLLRASRIG